MDPDKSLEILLNLCENWEKLPPKEVEDTFVKEISSLNKWLSNGGYPPKPWRGDNENM